MLPFVNLSARFVEKSSLSWLLVFRLTSGRKGDRAGALPPEGARVQALCKHDRA